MEDIKIYEEFKTNNEIKQKFLTLKKEYKEKHAMFSDCHESSSYKKIISMGYSIVPILIEEMKNDKNLNWSYILYEITKEWPIPKGEKNAKKYIEYWIKWFDEKYGF